MGGCLNISPHSICNNTSRLFILAGEAGVQCDRATGKQGLFFLCLLFPPLLFSFTCLVSLSGRIDASPPYLGDVTDIILPSPIMGEENMWEDISLPRASLTACDRRVVTGETSRVPHFRLRVCTLRHPDTPSDGKSAKGESFDIQGCAPAPCEGGSYLRLGRDYLVSLRVLSAHPTGSGPGPFLNIATQPPVGVRLHHTPKTPNSSRGQAVSMQNKQARTRCLTSVWAPSGGLF